MTASLTATRERHRRLTSFSDELSEIGGSAVVADKWSGGRYRRHHLHAQQVAPSLYSSVM